MLYFLSLGAAANTPLPTLKDRTLAWGLQTPHQQRRETLSGLTDTLGAGACVIDYNRDGWMDLLLLTGSGVTRPHGSTSWWQPGWRSERLYMNDNGYRFIDVTERVLPDLRNWSMGCEVEDLDADGHADLVLSGYNSAFVLYNNAGRFEAEPAHQDVLRSGWTTGVTVADFDNDGLPDIYFSAFIDYERGYRTGEALSGFAPLTPPTFNAELYDPIPNLLLLNQGDRSFIEADSLPDALKDAQGRGLAARVIVDADSPSRSVFLLNGRGSRSQDVGMPHEPDGSLVATNQTSTGLHYLTTFSGTTPENYQLLASTPRGEAIKYSLLGHGFDDPKAWEDEITTLEDMSRTGWDITLADFNLDGALDFVIANGDITPHPDASLLPQGQTNSLRLFDQGKYLDLSIGSPLSSSRSALRADFNNDGKPDLLFTNNNRLPALLINETREQGSWIGVRVLDEQGHDVTHHATITATTNAESYRALPFADQSLFGRHDPRALFRFSGNDERIAITVAYPNGEHFTHLGLSPGAYHTLTGTKVHREPRPVDGNKRRAFDKRHRRFQDLFLHLQLHQLEQLDTESRFLLFKALAEPGGASPRLVQHLPIQRNQQMAPILDLSLASDNPASVIAALEVAKRWELEGSVDSVVRLVDHTDEQIACKAAEVFHAWFEEEEAVTVGKYLAVPTLARVLTKSSTTAKTCALLALAEVESYRATKTIEGIAQSNDPTLATLAAYTLGKRRQATSAPVLKELQSRSTKPETLGVVAEEALQRLAMPVANQPRLSDKVFDWAVFQIVDQLSTKDAQLLKGFWDLGADKDAEDQSNPILAMVLSSDRYTDQKLIELLRRPDLPVDAIIHALSEVDQIPKERAIVLVNSALRHTSDEVIVAAVSASKAFLDSPLMAARLWRLLQHPNQNLNTKIATAWSLGTKEPQAVLEYLLSSGMTLHES